MRFITDNASHFKLCSSVFIVVVVTTFKFSRLVKIIGKNEKTELKEKFYKYMSVTSQLNCVYCMVFLFYPINYCNQFKKDYFCSVIYDNLFAQCFKIVCVAYLAEA
jgi:hypothetical protein